MTKKTTSEKKTEKMKFHNKRSALRSNTPIQQHMVYIQIVSIYCHSWPNTDISQFTQMKLMSILIYDKRQEATAMAVATQ